MSKSSIIAKNVMDVICKYRTLLDDSESCSMVSDNDLQQHIKRIEKIVEENKPLVMVLPAFPGKSPNKEKTLGNEPDLGEYHALDRLNNLCDEIKEKYSTGASVNICFDGSVFSDLVNIPEEEIDFYMATIKKYCTTNYPGYFSFYDIGDAFPKIKNVDIAREELLISYGDSILLWHDRIVNNSDTKELYRGITKFMYEDFLNTQKTKDLSKAHIQKIAKDVAIRVMQRSNAWGCLLEDIFPKALRLSIHPQARVSEKTGIKIANCRDVWRTPWHGVTVKEPSGEIYLTKRSQVDESLYRLIFNHGVPSHYEQNMEIQKHLSTLQ